MRRRVSQKPDVRLLLHNQIYGIVSREHGIGRTVVEQASLMLAEGIRVIQYREKDRPDCIKFEECLSLRSITRKHQAVFIVNDRPDIAKLCDADGVHLGQDDLSVAQAREIAGENAIIGLSTHSPEQARQAMADGVDYIGVGPVFSTQTKKNVVAAVGLEYVRFVSENIPIPFVAIGGIKEHNMLSVFEAGASCICLVTEIIQAENIRDKIKNLKRIMAMSVVHQKGWKV